MSSSRTHSPETLKRAATAWQGMKQLYGQSFVTIYGQQPTSLWLEKIAGLTDEQVGQGLIRLGDKPRAYPANLTEFVEACRPTPGSPRFLGVPETAEQRRKRLSAPRAKREHVDAKLANMRAALQR